jgi:LPXTG-motif cell wall-anchored protein
MKTSTLIKTTVLGVAIAASSSAMAKECSEVSWKPGVLSAYPQIAEACQGIHERNGKEYVELHAKFVRSVGDQVRIKFEHQDGDYGETFQTKNLPKDFKIDLEGRERSIHDLNRDSTMQVFIPTDRFALVADLDDSDELDRAAMASTSYTELPSTGSSLPLIALLGSLACSLGLALTVMRRRRSAKQ